MACEAVGGRRSACETMECCGVTPVAVLSTKWLMSTLGSRDRGGLRCRLSRRTWVLTQCCAEASLRSCKSAAARIHELQTDLTDAPSGRIVTA